MEIKRDIDDFNGIYDAVGWDDEAIAILDKILDEEKEDEAFEVIEENFEGDIPDEWDICEFIKNELLDELKNR